MLNLGRGNVTRIVRDIDMHIQRILSEQHIYRKPRLHFLLLYCS
jgi:hypothetical protein